MLIKKTNKLREAIGYIRNVMLIKINVMLQKATLKKTEYT